MEVLHNDVLVQFRLVSQQGHVDGVCVVADNEDGPWPHLSAPRRPDRMPLLPVTRRRRHEVDNDLVPLREDIPRDIPDVTFALQSGRADDAGRLLGLHIVTQIAIFVQEIEFVFVQAIDQELLELGYRYQGATDNHEE